MIYALINNETNLVENMVVWDGISLYNPTSYYLIETEQATFGDKYEDGHFYRLVINPNPETGEEPEELILVE
jgi:hypothetical protein